jgi:hypothetical protein
MTYAATPAAFSYAIKLTTQAVPNPAQRLPLLRELAGMNGPALSKRIDLLKAQIRINTTKVAATAPAAQPVPGHYMIDGAHIVIKVSKLTKFAYVLKDGCYLGNKHADAKAILADVAANGQTYAVAYAAKTGKCGVCNTKLTDPKSIAAGIGPVCAKKF